MFLLALTALSVLALLSLVAGAAVAVGAVATGNKAAIRAAAQVLRPDAGMPEHSQTNHPVSPREARVTSDASSPPATAGVCPASESDDLETRNTSAATEHGQLRLPRKEKAHGPDKASRTASPRPRIICGNAGRRRADASNYPALLC